MAIRNRNDLMEYLADHAPQPCIRRAVEAGGVENLGLFYIDPSHKLIAKVVSEHGKVWYVVFHHHVCVNRPKLYVTNNVPWDKWRGDNPPATPLMLGDHPDRYKELRDESNRENTNGSGSGIS